jgi:O-antigen/teichoic acid export membrane protein
VTIDAPNTNVPDVPADNRDFQDAPVGVLDTTEAGPRIIRGGALRVVGYVIGLVLSVGSSALAFRHLGVIDTGRLITVLALATIVGGLSDLGLSSLGIREYAVREGEDRWRFMRNLLGMRLAYTVVGVALATWFGLLAGYPEAMVLGIGLAGVGILLTAVQQSLAIPLSTELRLGWVAALQLLVQAGTAVGYVLLVVAGAELLPFFGVQAAAMLPVLVLTLVLVGRAAPKLALFDLRAWLRIMRQMLPYATAVVFYILYFRIAVVAVSLLSTGEEAGYYGASFRILDALTLVPPLLASSAFPLLARTARDDRDRFVYAVQRLTEGMLIVGIWMGLSLFLGADFAIDVVAGDEFERSVPVLRIQAFAIVGTCLLAAWGYALLSLGRERAIMVSNLASFALAAGTSLVLIRSEGAIGAAVALTVAELGLALGYGVSVVRARPEVAVALKLVPRVLLSATAAVAIPMALSLPALPAVLVGTALYAAGLTVTRAIPWEVRDALSGFRTDSRG